MGFLERMEMWKEQHRELLEALSRRAEQEHPFTPKLNKKSRALEGRSVDALSRGDAERIAQEKRALRERVSKEREEEERKRGEMSFRPHLNASTAESVLKVASSPDTYVKRLQERKAKFESKAKQILTECEDKAMSECSFVPATSQAPDYVLRIAENRRRRRQSEATAAAAADAGDYAPLLDPQLSLVSQAPSSSSSSLPSTTNTTAVSDKSAWDGSVSTISNLTPARHLRRLKRDVTALRASREGANVLAGIDGNDASFARRGKEARNKLHRWALSQAEPDGKPTGDGAGGRRGEMVKGREEEDGESICRTPGETCAIERGKAEGGQSRVTRSQALGNASATSQWIGRAVSGSTSMG